MGRSGIEYVSIQPPEGFLNTAQGQRQIHADVGLAVEGTSILPYDTHVPTGFQ